MAAGCLVCDKHATGEMRDGLVVFEDDLVIASHSLVGDRADAYLGYLFVEPKRHVAGLGELTVDEAADIGRLTNDVARAMRGARRREHVYLFVLGHDVAHLHLHVVPRYPGAPPEFRGLPGQGLARGPTGRPGRGPAVVRPPPSRAGGLRLTGPRPGGRQAPLSCRGARPRAGSRTS